MNMTEKNAILKSTQEKERKALYSQGIQFKTPFRPLSFQRIQAYG